VGCANSVGRFTHPTPQPQSDAYASSAPTRQITSTDATASADSSTNTPQQHDGWIYVPDTFRSPRKPAHVAETSRWGIESARS